MNWSEHNRRIRSCNEGSAREKVNVAPTCETSLLPRETEMADGFSQQHLCVFGGHLVANMVFFATVATIALAVWGALVQLGEVGHTRHGRNAI